MNIVVWKSVETDEDGTQHENWIANHVGRAVTASGKTAANAVFSLVRWLKASLDPKDSTVANIDTVIYECPEFPEDHIPSAEAGMLFRKRRLTREDRETLYAEASLAWRVRGLPAPTLAEPRHLYPESISLVRERFEAGTKFADEYVDIPDGWDVRIWEG